MPRTVQYQSRVWSMSSATTSNARCATAACRASRRASSARVGDGQIAHAVDMALELVARMDGPDARGRAGEDEIPGLYRDELRQIGDLLLHVPDLLREVALLPRLPVHLDPDRALGRMADLGGSLQRGA